MACHFPFHAARRTHENTLTAARDLLHRCDPDLGVLQLYGMRALLILYLTHQLGFDDSHAISLFSAYASLVYVTPILGGWLADRLLGNRTAVIAGALLMTLGHVVLGVESTSAWSLYVALAIIICGYGLFKSNISCLLGELYAHDDPRRDGGFSLLYAAGNVGSIAAPIACGLAAQWYGWHIGFALAGDRYVYRPDDFLKRQPPLPAYPRRR